MSAILFVCLGNICRSPAAEGSFRAFLEARGAAESIALDSAGTGAWHVGNPPDPRMIQAARRRGIDLSELRARKVQASDWKSFDWIIAMDRDNHGVLGDRRPPGPVRARLALLGDFVDAEDPPEVPDPYYGDGEGFERVLDLLDSAWQPLLERIQADRAS